MNIVDIIIIAMLIVYIFKGFASGAIKELVTFVGGFAVLVIAFLLKNPLSVYMYEHLPFFHFGGILSGISVLNIVVYELIAFLLAATGLMIIYKIIIGATNIIEKIVKITVILEIPSKIFGAIIGFVEGLVTVFILLYICIHMDYTRSYIEESKYSNTILTKTPVLSNAVDPFYNAITEIFEVANTYKDAENKTEANLQSLDILLKYKILDIESADYLVENKKLEIDGVETVLSKYRKGE